MRANEPVVRRDARRDPTLADVLARRLAQIGLIWAVTPILTVLFIGVALALFAAWGLLIVVMAWVGGLVGLTTGGAAGPFVLGALVVSGVILFRPTLWTVRNLRRVEGSLDARIDALAIPTTVEPGAVVEHRPITPAELAALDARLAPPPPASPAVEPPTNPPES